jgi:hypothetical protein
MDKGKDGVVRRCGRLWRFGKHQDRRPTSCKRRKSRHAPTGARRSDTPRNTPRNTPRTSSTNPSRGTVRGTHRDTARNAFDTLSATSSAAFSTPSDDTFGDGTTSRVTASHDTPSCVTSTTTRTTHDTTPGSNGSTGPANGPTHACPEFRSAAWLPRSWDGRPVPYAANASAYEHGAGAGTDAHGPKTGASATNGWPNGRRWPAAS